MELQIAIQEENGKEKSTRNKDLIKENMSEIKEKTRELKSVQKSVQKLISFENLIIIMADTPQEGFFANIMSLMSQDSSRNQEYIFTDKTEGKKTESTGNIIQGTPVIFSAQVIDDSESKRFGEKNRRSILITPNTDDDKLRSVSTADG